MRGEIQRSIRKRPLSRFSAVWMLVGFVLVSSTAGRAVLNAAPERGPVPAVICYNGAVGSKSRCIGYLEFGSDVRRPYLKRIRCGFPGKASEITVFAMGGKEGAWKLKVRRDFPVGSADRESESKEILFRGERVIVFEDEHQTVTIENHQPKPPNGSVKK